MQPDTRRNKHHFLARHVIQHFAAADGLLRVYDRRQAWKSRRDIPERLAMEKYLYAPEFAEQAGDDPKDDTVERWLATTIDTPACVPFNDLAGGAALADLSGDALHAVADFVAVLDLRTPAIRDLLMPAFASAAAIGMSDISQTRNELRRKGLSVSKSDIRKRLRKVRKPLSAGLAKPGWLEHLMNTRQIARINVKARRWIVLDAPPGSEFITSDLGIAKSLLGPLEPVPWEPGTRFGRAHWIIPFSPTRALAITPTLAPDPVSSAELVQATNRQLLSDARRYAYSQGEIAEELLAAVEGSRGTSGTPPSAL